jgi:hypothetical protein
MMLLAVLYNVDERNVANWHKQRKDDNFFISIVKSCLLPTSLRCSYSIAASNILLLRLSCSKN